MSLNYLETPITISNGKIIRGAYEVAGGFKNMNPGEYIMTIRLKKDWLTIDGCRRAYFQKIDVVRDYTGYSRQEVHQLFKTEKSIGSTRELSVEDWTKVLEALTLWAFNQYDCLV